MVVILAWNLSRRDLRIFLTNLGLQNLFSKIECWIHYVLELGIEFIKQFILIHPNFLKASSEPLKVKVLNISSALISVLKYCPNFLDIVNQRTFLEFFICYITKKSIQCPTVKVRSLDLSVISCCGWLFRLCPTYFDC